MSALTCAGFTNQLVRESGAWWSTRRWWVQALTWAGVTNGLLAMMLWVLPRLSGLGGAAPGLTGTETAVQFAGMAGMLASVGTVVVAQGLMIDERRHGLLEWMLSKPISRPALLLAKFSGSALALLGTVVVLPWLGVLAQLSAHQGSAWPPARWLGALLLVGVLVLFHLALVLALSTLTWSRALVVALPLAGIVGSDLLVAAAPRAFDLLPWSIGRLTGVVLTDGVLVTPWPVISALVATLLLLGAATWGLVRTEL